MDLGNAQRMMEKLNQELMLMGALVEQQLMELEEIFIDFKEQRVTKILMLEEQINIKQINIDELCVELIAQFSPKAKDLRSVFAISKMNNDLERIGDQLRNCALIMKDTQEGFIYLQKDQMKSMIFLAKKMVILALDAFSLKDMAKSHLVLSLDDDLDQKKNDLIEISKKEIEKKPQNVAYFLNQIFLAKNFERIGDHATNLVEEVIYLITGQDIRHGGKHA